MAYYSQWQWPLEIGVILSVTIANITTNGIAIVITDSIDIDITNNFGNPTTPSRSARIYREVNPIHSLHFLPYCAPHNNPFVISLTFPHKKFVILHTNDLPSSSYDL